MDLPTSKDTLEALERHRQRLEDSIASLRIALKHWQTWEIDYEALKEEILALPDDITQSLPTVVDTFEGELLTKAEIREILGLSKQPRTNAQSLDILAHRIAYVQQNVRSLETQIASTGTRAAAAAVISAPDDTNEEGLPITEIIEELDDEDRVVSARTQHPADTATQLWEKLGKAGLERPLMDSDTASDLSAKGSVGKQDSSRGIAAVSAESTSSQAASSAGRVPLAPAAAAVSPTRRKSVTFSEDAKAGPEPEMSATAKKVRSIMEMAREQNGPPKSKPIIPEDDSVEDGSLRREMLEYAMSEIGPVVAELTLDNDSDFTNEDDEDEDMTSSDEEDELGRSKKSVVDDDYRQRMQALQQRVDSQMADTGTYQGLSSVDSSLQTPPASIGTPIDPSSTTGKSVRFADSVNVAGTATSNNQILKKQISTAPITDIVERLSTNDDDTPKSQPAPAKTKVSRFKAARKPSSPSTTAPNRPPTLLPFQPTSDPTHTIPTGPRGTTLAQQIIEREVPIAVDTDATSLVTATTALPDAADATDAADAPDEFDPQLVYQEAAVAYARHRDARVHAEGGYLRELEHELPVTLDEDGKARRMSRFKAARLGML